MTLLALAPLLSLLGAGLAYTAAALAPRPNRRAWPATRLLAWWAGLGAAGAALAGPLAHRASPDLVADTLNHLLLGMLAPLLLVLAAPVTLALRTLPTSYARRLARLLASPPARVLTAPVVAALLNVGGLWLLYRTGLHAAAASSPALHAAVSVHMLGAGYLFTSALVGPDPAPHRPGYPHRAAVLVAALAAHAVLAKSLYAYSPAGVPAERAQLAGQLMWYGGDLVHLGLLVVFCRQWYATAARGRVRPARQRSLLRQVGNPSSS